MKYLKVSTQIMMCIDSWYISKSPNVKLNIKGWVFSKKSKYPLNIEVLEMKTENIKIMQYKRQDVFKVYPKYEGALNSGFTIIIDDFENKGNIKIKFQDETKERNRIYNINVNELLKLKRVSRNIKKCNAFQLKTHASVNQDRIKKNKKGINLIGYSRAETGLGEACRATARALDADKISFCVKNFDVYTSTRENDFSWTHKEIDKPIYNVNIIHVNPPELPKAYEYLGRDYWPGRYNIGFWLWELTDFPNEWIDRFKYVDEVWAPSKFVVNSLKAKSPVPVIHIPHSFKIETVGQITRKNLGLPDNTFLFLTMYDIHSLQVRKNPRGVIETFMSTFKPNDKSVGLVVKINSSSYNPREVQGLIELVKGYNNIYFITETLDRADVYALLNMVDCFVSLHRAEGFGAVLAEAMYLGTPVIGTNWSGNTDFMNEDNSCLVKYKLVKLGKNIGPYKANQKWADADKENASYYMEKLFSDKNYYNKISRNGMKTIRNLYAPEKVGEMIRNRLNELNLL